MLCFSTRSDVNGWDFTGNVGASGRVSDRERTARSVLGPSLDALAGMDGEVWTGQFDFTLLRPVDTQFLASFRKWRLFALFDLVLGLGVLGVAVTQLNQTLTATHLVAFLVTLGAGVTILYAILLAFAGLVFWSPASSSRGSLMASFKWRATRSDYIPAGCGWC